MHVVTVTCNRDYNQMVLQAESISMFLTPCTHWVIINEETVDIERWKSALSPYYIKHTLNLLTLKDFKPINSKSGWVTQQVLKLRISEHINNDYLILDTKNFFIKFTDLSFWENKIGDGNLYTLDDSSAYSYWRPASTLYANKLNVPELTDIFFISAGPFKIKIKYLKNVDMDFLQECLLINSEIDPCYVSEYVLYSYLAKNEINHKTGKILKSEDVSLIRLSHLKNFTDRQSFAYVVKKVMYAKYNDNIKIFGFHQPYLMSANNQHLNFINSFLKSLGFITQFHPQ